MVEGHSVHRIAHRHSSLLVGHKYKATSPNGRFKQGAKDITGKILRRTDAKGKQLFYWFSNEGKGNSIATLQKVKDLTIVNIHFGMSGQFPTFNAGTEPPTTTTTRLKLVRDDDAIIGYVSAMTLISGGMEIFHNRFEVLGEDPLREDSDPVALYEKVQNLRPKGNSTKTIGQLLMDQAFFPGVGNIYRAECLFVAGVWPNARAQNLTMEEFTLVWNSCVKLLQMGFQKGSIITVEENERKIIKARRYIYNRRTCARCLTQVLTWDVNKRTCYACPQCQKIGQEKNLNIKALPLPSSLLARKKAGLPVTIQESTIKLESQTYEISTVKDLKTLCKSQGLPQKGKKGDIIQRLLENDERLKNSTIQEATIKVKSNSYEISSVKDLKLLCKSRRLSQKGKKNDIIRRLLANEDKMKIRPIKEEITNLEEPYYKKLNYKDIREICKKLRIQSSGKKAFLISLIEKCLKETTINRSALSVPGKGTGPMESYLSAFYEKLEANEKRNVEHVADLDFTSVSKTSVDIDGSLTNLTPSVLAQSKLARVSKRIKKEVEVDVLSIDENEQAVKNICCLKQSSHEEEMSLKRTSYPRNIIYKNKRVK